MASSTVNRWLRPEVYPLFAAVGVAVGICGFQLVRNVCINPEVRVTKENRAAGVLENFSEGEKYAEHALRKFVRNRAPEIMPSINGFFSDPKQQCEKILKKHNFTEQEFTAKNFPTVEGVKPVQTVFVV